jgi:alpha-aminoadipate carrier protein LysW
MVICPKCSSDLDFEEDELDEGDEFTCEECGANLRVVSLDPIELELTDDDGDDDDFDEDEDDEDEEEEDDFEEEEEEEKDDDWR